MPLSDIVTVNISVQSTGVTQAGFGVPLILSHTAGWVERVRFYASLTGVASDFDSDEPEYLAAQALFSQNPAPERIAIGRVSVSVTQRWRVVVTAVANTTDYKIKVGANTATITSGGSATNDAIIAALDTAVDALSGDTLTATQGGSALTKYLILTGDVANDWNAVEVLDVNLLALIQDHDAPAGLADELTAIRLETDAWYTIVSLYNSRAYIAAVAAWAEANEKLYIVTSQDSIIRTDTPSADSDIAQALKEAAYARTACTYHPNNGVFFDAAWQGKCLPLDPGSETWKFKTLATIPTTQLTTTHQTNLGDRNCNYYYTVAGINITVEGVVAAGEFIDVVRFRDWLKARMSERIFALLARSKKVPFTDAGIALIEAEIRAQLAEGITAGGLAANPAPTVTVPKASAVPTADKTARRLTGVSFTAVLAGAIHKLTINGTITV